MTIEMSLSVATGILAIWALSATVGLGLAIKKIKANEQQSRRQANTPGGLVDQRTDDADQGRLAGAVRPQQGIEVAGGDVQADPLQGLHAVVVGLSQVADAQRGRGARAIGGQVHRDSAAAGRGEAGKRCG